jgi:hypothetical protein
MKNALIINHTNAHTVLVKLKNVVKLKSENFCTSGVVLFFDDDNEMLCFGCAIDDVLSLAKTLQHPDAKSYYIIKDEKYPLTEEEVNNIYDCIYSETISMFIINQKESIKVTICQN